MSKQLMASGSTNHNPGCNSNSLLVPITNDDITFEGLQNRRMKELERRLSEEVKRKRHEWEKHVDRMKEEFLRLYPADRVWGSDELINDPYIRERRGSTDILDRRKMKTLYMEYPECGRKFKLRFDVGSYERDSVKILTDGDRIVVNAIKLVEDDNGDMVEKCYTRKIAKPKDVDLNKLKSVLTSDGVLIIEAQLPPHSLNLRKMPHSPSHSSHDSHGSRTSMASSRSRSPSNSPSTPSAKPKYGVPTFRGEDDERVLSLIVDIGTAFKPKDITVQIIKDNRILVKAKHEERTSERMCKAKFCKEYELSEKIETFSLRAGLTESGKLMVGALGKGHKSYVNRNGESSGNSLNNLNPQNGEPCNVLDLANFPPVNLTMTSSTSTSSS